jgi:signal transduction histidine kinase
MTGRATVVAGALTALAGGCVFMAWALGSPIAATLVAGWRVMVPSTAFGFLCVGAGLTAAAFDRPAAVGVVRLLALAALVIPALTLVEYGAGVRLGVESWLGISFAADPPDAYAGRMSPVTAVTFVLLSTALAALTWRGPWAARLVRHAGGGVLTISWLAVLAVSFEEARLADTPQFPGMAAMTILLFAVSSAGVLACSSPVVARLRDAHADVVVSRSLIAAAFILPLVLAAARLQLERRLDDGVAAAIVTVLLALAITALAWRGAARLQGLQRQRSAMLAELESRVADRTRELADANERLQRSEERLLEADRRKDDFLAMLAHELRNPLAPIRTSVQLLKDEHTPAEVRTRAHQVIDRQVDHTVRLIDDLLDVSRIAAGKLVVRTDRVDVSQIVRQAVEITAAAVDRAAQRLELKLPPEPVLIAGDATRLTQVVANLLQNASKFTPQGGHIAASAAVEEDAAVIRVRDNGIGIPPSFLPRLFERFSQGAAPPGQAEGGLGLGLAVVHGIVTLHGGSVEAHSEGAGRGSEFVVRLPLAVPRPGSGVRIPLASGDDGGRPAARRRVLVADDNLDNTASLAMLLRHQGHEVETATDGQSAYDAAERFRPDVVLLDLGMPKISG